MSDPSSHSRPETGVLPDDGLAAVVGYPAVAQRLRSIAVQPVRAAWAGIPDVVAPAGVLLYGPPGDAASALGVALGRELGVADVTYDARVGGPLAQREPCLVHVVGLDVLHRVAGGPGRTIDRLFEEVAECSSAARPLIVATSMAPWHLDPRLLTTGRFDRLVFVPPPSWEARSVALRSLLVERGVDVAQRISLLAAATVGWSGADLDELVDQLGAEASGAPTTEVGQSAQLLDVVSRIMPRTKSWIGRAREMADIRAGDGMMDDLVTWLRRAG
jgi:SpoVK/Ycf46/Vps4 family AAA+-type ATPase